MNSNQKKTLDRMWQHKITEGKRCSRPGCNWMGTEGHHIFKRRYLNTRWDIENGRALCRPCHIYTENNPQAYENLIVGEIGQDEWDRLRHKALMVVRQDYKELKEGLKNGEG